MILAAEHTSFLLQIIAAVMAIICIKKTPHFAWLFVILALLSIGARRVMNFLGFSLPPYLPEIVGAVCVIAGVVVIYRLFVQYNQNIRHLRSLREIDHAMLSSLNHNGVMSTIVERINTTLCTDAAAVLTINPSNGIDILNTEISYNLSSRLQEFIRTRSNGFVAAVIDNRKPLIISNISPDEHDPFLSTLRAEGFSSYLGVPIVIKRTLPIGVLTLYTRKPRKYTEKELDFIHAISDQIAITLDRTQLLGRIKELNYESVRALAEAIEIRDPYTRGHSNQVADLAVMLAKELGFKGKELSLIKFAGLLHDIGKIAVPESILQKADTLTEEEWITIKKHPFHSAQILDPVNNLRKVKDWILHHHERWDGNGYPNHKKGIEIPLQARILAVCDTYSAMFEDRPYRKGLKLNAIKEEIKRVAGTQLDPVVAQAFLNLDLEEFNRRAYEKMERQLHLPLTREGQKKDSIFSSLYPEFEG